MNRKKKVVSLIPGLFGGGAEKMVAMLSEYLSSAYDHEIVTYQPIDSRAIQYIHYGKLHNLQVPKHKGKIKKALRNVVIINRLKKYLKNVKPDIIISHTTMSCIHNAMIGTDAKKIFVIHGEYDYKALYGNSKIFQLYKYIYRKCDTIVTVSDYIKKDFTKLHNSSIPVQVIHNGLKIQEIKNKASVDSSVALPDKYLVYVAQFRPEKRHLLLIKNIASFLHESDYKLVLVGDGPLYEAVQKEVEHQNLSHSVIFANRQENPYPILARATASLIASDTESFSLSTVESLVLGIPVITTDCGGPSEILGKTEGNSYPYHTPYGLILDNQHPAFSVAAYQVIQLKESGIFNKEIIENRGKLFSSEAMAQAYISLIEQLA